MNIGPMLVLIKLFQDARGDVSPIKPFGPKDPKVINPQNVPLKPICGPGHYAYKEPLSGLWSCLVIPKGR